MVGKGRGTWDTEHALAHREVGQIDTFVSCFFFNLASTNPNPNLNINIDIDIDIVNSLNFPYYNYNYNYFIGIV